MKRMAIHGFKVKRQIKLDHIKKQANLKGKNSSGLLVDMFDDDDEIPCANCFI